MSKNSQKIVLVSFDLWDYDQYIIKEIENLGHDVTHINFNGLDYKYPHVLYKVYNFFLKTFLDKNVKRKQIHDFIVQRINGITDIDQIIVFRGDLLEIETLEYLKNKTEHLKSFYFDSINRMNRKKKIISFFDEIWTFDPRDAKKYNLKFLPNFNYFPYSLSQNKDFIYKVFNISSYEKKRFQVLEKIADYLNRKNISQKIIIVTDKSIQSPHITITSKSLSREEVDRLMTDSKILLDIQRKKQTGLSFRVFEAMGKHKKLISTNQDIKNYSFYNPNNIFIIDNPNHMSIPDSFFETNYEAIPEDVYNEYYIKNWVEKLLTLR